jgi:hypothetical protein
LEDPDDLARQAAITATSRLRLGELKDGGPRLPLTASWAQMLPLPAGRAPRVSFRVDVAAPASLTLQLRIGGRPDDYTPDAVLAEKTVDLPAGEDQVVVADFDVAIDTPRYAFYCLLANERVSVHTSGQRVTGVLAVRHHGTQAPREDIGVETFEFWPPQRRPGGHNLAVTIDPPLDVFAERNVTNGFARPTDGPNAWVADFDDPAPALTLRWEQPQTIGHIELGFDADFDHPMESVLMGHPEAAMPFCVRDYRILDDRGRVVAEKTGHHQTRAAHLIEPPITTQALHFAMMKPHASTTTAFFEVRCIPG